MSGASPYKCMDYGLKRNPTRLPGGLFRWTYSVPAISRGNGWYGNYGGSFGYAYGSLRGGWVFSGYHRYPACFTADGCRVREVRTSASARWASAPAVDHRRVSAASQPSRRQRRRRPQLRRASPSRSSDVGWDEESRLRKVSAIHPRARLGDPYVAAEPGPATGPIARADPPLYDVRQSTEPGG